jgi:uncharacterized protein YbjQ (UPF0145 family)
MICLFVVGLVSCAAKTDPEIKQRAQAIPVTTASKIEGRSYELLGKVEGKDCARYDLSGDASSAEWDSSHSEGMITAAWKMRVAAAKLGADAIVNISCVDKLGWPSMDCGIFKIECRGHAIRWRAEKEGEVTIRSIQPY